MLRVVVDTSSLVSYMLTRGDLMSRIVEYWRSGSIVLVSSPATRDELSAVLTRPSIPRLSTVPLDEFARGMERFTENVPGTIDLAGACRDPKDVKFLVCAQEGKAQYIVSSDRDLLDLHRFGDIAIVNPGEFLVAYELHTLEPVEIAARFRRDVLTSIHANIPLDSETETRLSTALEIASGKGEE